jgi:hypothetical protein
MFHIFGFEGASVSVNHSGVERIAELLWAWISGVIGSEIGCGFNWSMQHIG